MDRDRGPAKNTVNSILYTSQAGQNRAKFRWSQLYDKCHPPLLRRSSETCVCGAGRVGETHPNGQHLYRLGEDSLQNVTRFVIIDHFGGDRVELHPLLSTLLACLCKPIRV